MRRPLSGLGVFILGAAVLAAQAAVPAAQTTGSSQVRADRTAAPTKSSKGTIQTFANKVLTIKTVKGSETFSVTSDTIITKAGKKVDTAALTQGEMVNVRYTEASGTMKAAYVTIAAVPPPKKTEQPGGTK